eukprot:SAG11_NODE_8130_length_1057_cov_1.558455_1_plen_45_part_10
MQQLVQLNQKLQIPLLHGVQWCMAMVVHGVAWRPVPGTASGWCKG